MKQSLRVDTMSAFDQMAIEDFLESVAAEGWELLQIVPRGDGLILIIHRKLKRRWWQ